MWYLIASTKERPCGSTSVQGGTTLPETHPGVAGPESTFAATETKR